MKDIIKKVLKENEPEWYSDIVSKASNIFSNKSTTDHSKCSDFTNESKLLCLGLNNLKYELSDRSGLNLDTIVRGILEPYKTNIPTLDLNKYIEGLRLLYKTKKFNREYIIKIKEDLDNAKLIYVDGVWHHVNKLNTNYSDLAEMLTDYIVKYKSDYIPQLVNELTVNKPNALKIVKGFIPDLTSKFKFEDLLTFTKNTTVNTKVGEDSEAIALGFLTERGFKIDYTGGNGDFLDMIFGVDIIADMKLIQVKASVSGVTRIKPHIDWVIVSNQYQGIGVYGRDGNVVEYNGHRLCEGRLCNINVPF